MYLSQVNEAYGESGLALTFVVQMFSSIYAQGNANGVCNADVLNMNANLFLSQYGNQCSMFDMLIYTGTYRSKYKSEFATSGDLSDVIKQFPKYLKHKGFVQDANKPKQQEEPQQKEKKLVGKEALEYYLRKAAERGDNLLEGGLVSFGVVSRQHAQEIMERYAPEPF